jgi:hypothetical protein
MDQPETDAPLKKTLRSSREALIQKAMDEPDLGQRVLITLNAFRLLISAALLVIFSADTDPRFFGEMKPTLFAATAAGYIVFALLSAISLRQRWVPEKILGVSQLLVDTMAIALLMHASGGISSGLGGLLVELRIANINGLPGGDAEKGQDICQHFRVRLRAIDIEGRHHVVELILQVMGLEHMGHGIGPVGGDGGLEFRSNRSEQGLQVRLYPHVLDEGQVTHFTPGGVGLGQKILVGKQIGHHLAHSVHMCIRHLGGGHGRTVKFA